MRILVDGRVMQDRYYGIGPATFELLRELCTRDMQLIVLHSRESGRLPVSELLAEPAIQPVPSYVPVASLRSQHELWRAAHVPARCRLPFSPTGVQAVHPDGEVAVARAAAARGTVMSLSSFASKPVEEVAAANPRTFFQMYWVGGRDEMAARMERARAAGAVGLIATLDWSFSFGRDWGSPHIPERLSLREMIRHAPEAAVRPAWLAEWLRTGAIPDLTVPNMPVGGAPAPTFFGAYAQWMGTVPPSWDDVAWLREQWGGPFMLKGVTRADDAKRAVDAGVTAISVSNHGGNNLDGTPATIRLLPDIARAVGDQAEVLLDGGVRRGGDVVKALALGARAVMIGRAYLWGLAANGQAGVENVLDLLRSGIDACLLGLGHASITELSPEELVIPAGSTRRLGG
jgi:L-lactate dehydrogenase (cytochrome)/glycolate oxidase